jgi:hypothetical protein
MISFTTAERKTVERVHYTATVMRMLKKLAIKIFTLKRIPFYLPLEDQAVKIKRDSRIQCTYTHIPYSNIQVINPSKLNYRLLAL